ncbi:hypothetical protein AB0I72_23370 [Nocardiopsis sp. NPDC049922]|uniref:hypothetical protein n=1 Tax=Nocardiopsis sp. NPDC049922 TaxID=3155157 RepID=UPI0033E832E9
MTTMALIHQLGFGTVLIILTLNVLVALLRFAVLPFAAAVLVLDTAANLAARPLPIPTTTGRGNTR